jgi:hypothetical protein
MLSTNKRLNTAAPKVCYVCEGKLVFDLHGIQRVPQLPNASALDVFLERRKLLFVCKLLELFGQTFNLLLDLFHEFQMVVDLSLFVKKHSHALNRFRFLFQLLSH